VSCARGRLVNHGEVAAVPKQINVDRPMDVLLSCLICDISLVVKRCLSRLLRGAMAVGSGARAA